MKKVVEQSGLGQKHVGPGWVAEGRLGQRMGNSKQSEARGDAQVGGE